MANNENKKNKKPFLTWGLILLGFVLASILTIAFVGFSVLSPAIFIRNVALLMAMGGAGVGLGRGVIKGFDRLINGPDKEKSAKKNRKLGREQEKELEQEEDLEQEEELVQDRKENKTLSVATSKGDVSREEDYDEDEEFDYDEDKNNVNKQGDTKNPVSRGGR